MEITDFPTDQEIKVFSQLLADGARDGHYAKEHLSSDFNQEYLSSIQKNQNIPGYPTKGLIFIFKENNQPVCFSVVCGSQFANYTAEILMFSVPKPQRRKGYAKEALKIIIEEVQGQNIIARCMPRSTHMFKALEASGFSRVDIGPSSNVNYGYING
ncbi:GNAT family N-acetyltransferase [Vreelandella nigrificans]|uniref:N-acetyltransferase domain-containing protein n=1 Tax=Vreelandella nigrificans TaxID=2042704 RepID=A0A2A4HLG4_9GAMM|nr:GNAT family N-acetyltransferase [Halomonas nigrificans]PCF95620.1 hypothetical protein CPA45_11250 [Halomonas nigrificans]